MNNICQECTYFDGDYDEFFPFESCSLGHDFRENNGECADYDEIVYEEHPNALMFELIHKSGVNNE